MIPILNSLWKLYYVDPGHDVLKKSDGQYSLGLCDTYNQAIYIANNLKFYKFKTVLAHELFHAYVFEAGIFVPEMEEEMLCNLVAEKARDIVNMVDLLSQEIEKARA